MGLDLILPTLAEILTNPIKQYVILPIKRHVSYAFNYEIKVDRLREVACRLKVQRVRLEHSVADATRNGEEIYDNVTNWLITSGRVIEEAQELVDSKEAAAQKRCFMGLCPNLKKRYQLSKKADRKVSAIHKVQSEEGLDSISYRPPSKQIVAPSVYSREGLPSRMSILKEVMDALKDPNLNMIGVYGMGGVGKTTLVKEVHRQSLADKLFDNVIMVVVSQTPDLRRIQAEIAEVLDLDLVKEGMLIRANILSERLKKEKILIIMDDIWQPLQLEEVGIPSRDDCQGCKLLLTSRRREVLCSEMGVQKDFKLEVLPEEEGRALFQMTVDDAQNPKLLEVAKKCAGLPLLILRVATDLRNKDSRAWNDKLMQLSEFRDEEIQEKIHSVLESSYDNLPGNEVKSFFLLCGLFGQANIQIQHLLMYSMGLGLLKHRATVEQSKDRVYKLISDLKDNCLLLDGDIDGFVKMHDVVRDTAMSIASREQHAFIGLSDFRSKGWPEKTCTRISLLYNDIHELPGGLECPEAELLFLISKDFSLSIPDSFFEGMTKLKVLDFTGMHFESLPSSLGLLLNLHTLCLHRAQLDNVAIIGKLRQLEVLSFAESYIVELPREIEHLTRLKLLDLSNCSKLKVIPADVLSKLSQLEALYMSNSFVEWEAEGNARLGELECLSGLTTLELQVLDAKIIPKSLFLIFNGLQNYRIVIGEAWDWSVNNESSRTLKLRFKTSIQLERGVLKLLKETEDLYLDEVRGIENVLYDLDGDGFPQLKHLHVLNDTVIRHIINSTMWSSFPAFPVLQSLFLDNLMNLENICCGQLAEDSFRKLKVLEVENCERLITLFSSSSSMGGDIVDAESVEDDNNVVVELPHLCSLKLDNLPQLRSFYHEQKVPLETQAGEPGTPSSLFIRQVSLPNLEDLQIASISCEKIWQDQLSATTSNLTSLIVNKCNNLTYLFTASIVESLLQLKKLEVGGCLLMEEIILSEESVEDGETTTRMLFPKLDILRLEGLPKLIRFSRGFPIEFQSLRELYISMCDALTIFIPYPPRTDMMSTVNSDVNSSSEVHSLFNEMVGLSNLEDMKLKNMGDLKNIWHSQLAPDSFCKLKSLLIFGCRKLLTVFPPNELSRFHRLEKLWIDSCVAVQEIFQFKGLNDEETIVAFRLRELIIWGLSKLKFIWSKDPQTGFTFQELKSIDVSYCEALKNIFPTSMAKGLLQLQSMNIINCGVEEIIGKTEESGELHPNFKFPELITLKLSKLSEVRSFCPVKHSAKFPKLKCLDVTGCHKAFTFGSEIALSQVAQPLFFLEKLNPNIEELTLLPKDLKRLQHGQLVVDFLSKIKVLKLLLLKDESCCFLFGFLKRMYNVEKLVVFKVFSEELFSDELSVGEKEYFGALIRLKHLEISEAYNLKHIWTQDAGLTSIFQYLEALIIKNCDSLNNIGQSSLSFQNLATLEVSGCPKLKSLLSVSTAKTMVQLTRMRVHYCKMITEVVENNGDDTEDEIIFSKLKVLELEALPCLASFCSGNYALSFPVLEEVIVGESLKMKNFSGGFLSTPKLRSMRRSKYSDKQFWEGNLNATVAYLSIEVVGTHFKLSNRPELKKNWHDKHMGRRFCNVISLIVDECELLTEAISTNLLLSLNMLRWLEVRNCASAEEVFDLEGMSANEGHVGLLPRLSQLHLIDLPMLRCLWNKDPKGILDFKNLKMLIIQNCSSLKYAFTQTVAFCLVQLQQVQLKNCHMMESVVEDEESSFVQSKIIFPSLSSIVLECLPNFSGFCSPSGSSICPALKKISIHNCPNVVFFSKTDDREEEKGCKDMLDIKRKPLFSLKVLPNLEELSFDSKSTKMMLGCEFPLEFFSKVKVLELCHFPPQSCFILIGFLQRFPHLEKLVVSSSSLKELLLFGGYGGDQEDAMILPQIRALKLDGLDDLKNIWNENSQLQSTLFEHLDTLEVGSCGNLIDLAPSSVSFQNLTTLKVWKCNKLASLIPFSVAKSMVQLVTLSAEHCDMLIEIIGGGKERISDEIVFSKMSKLKLDNLHSLKSFCLESHTYKFPSLEQVTISCCPNLGNFCSGDLRTPKLHIVELNFNSHWEGDLNSTIQQNHIKMVGFRRLMNLQLSKFPMLKENLVDEHASFSNAIPSNLLEYLGGLEVLVVEKCDSVEQVFDMEGPIIDETDEVLMHRLKELHLIDLPKLRHMWNKDPQGILSFKNLKLLKVENCSNLTHILTLSMALRLENLQHIEVKRCSLVEQIITAGEEHKVWEKIVFPCLQSITLEGLPSLLSFYSAKDVLKCPTLKVIDVVDCPRMKLFPSAFSSGQDSSMISEIKELKVCEDTFISPLFGGKVDFQSLEELRVEWNSIKHMWHDKFQEEFFDGLKALELKCFPGKFPILPSDFLQSFTNLERLAVTDSFPKEMIIHEADMVFEEKQLSLLPQSEVFVSSLVSFQNLTALEVSKCHGLISLITASAANFLGQLKKLDIKECEMIQEIITPEDGLEDHEIRFSQLTFLRLHGLPFLTGFCSGNFELNFPSLEELIIRECPRMKTFAKNVLSSSKLWRVQTGEHEYEWEWEGSINRTVQTLFMEMNAEESS